MTLKTAINKMCKALEHPQYPQCTGSLVEFDCDGKITEKCALGEISCQVGLKIKQNANIDYGDILETAGIPKWLRHSTNLPYVSKDHHQVSIRFYKSYGSNLQDYIWKMNDSGYTYPQIVEFLRCTFT